MKLAFDTATDQLTVAIGTGEKILAEFNETAPRTHLNRLLPEIKRLLTLTGTAITEIDCLGVGIGPGSFTGVRIGVATAQGLAHALKIPLVGVATLDAVAAVAAGAGEHEIHPVLDAKRREIFTARYNRDGRRLSDYEVMLPEKLVERLAQTSEPVLLTGDGLDKYANIFASSLGKQATFAPRTQWAPRASVIIRRLEERINEGPVGPYFKVAPLYLRLSDAEENLKRVK